MPTNYRTPGVYVEEKSTLAPSVASVATAIPAFIGYTEKAPRNEQNPDALIPTRITNLLEYEHLFGKGAKLFIENEKLKNSEFVLYDSVRLYYDNGGGVCYVVSVGQYGEEEKDKESLLKKEDDLIKGINEIAKVDEVTLLLFPDAINLKKGYEDVQKAALKQCADLGDRFAILDVPESKEKIKDYSDDFRTKIDNNDLMFGAAYTPCLKTSYTKHFEFNDIVKTSLAEFVEVEVPEGASIEDPQLKFKNTSITKRLSELSDRDKEIIITANQEAYDRIYNKYADMASVVPPSGAIAGVMASIDYNKGVWMAPANVSLRSVSGLTQLINNNDQDDLNIPGDGGGKSINAIRAFAGKGIMVWGARTLNGLSNEWRYIPVRRFFNYVEESVQKSTSWAVFSPNDANTWIKIKCQIENFLTNLWRSGALFGAKPEDAFFVKVGLGITMTEDDINNGYLIVEIGLAAIRPAEFIILRFSHKTQ
ncbi:MAG: phage tail sheath family protein [Tannerella sp.]|uniref:phage tail sheath family protein n=1 Tax=Tannerella sp. TaxID=2382127 RepID=UPI003FA2051D